MLVSQALLNEGNMKMATSPEPTSDELRPEYDFKAMKGVVRGKYTKRYQERLRVVRIAENVAAAFTDEAAVNEALRQYLRDRTLPSIPA